MIARQRYCTARSKRNHKACLRTFELFGMWQGVPLKVTTGVCSSVAIRLPLGIGDPCFAARLATSG